MLLPSKKQRGRTSIQRGPNPVFKEKVTFAKLEHRDVAACAVRFRMYAARKMTRERMMGEKFYLSHLHPEREMKVTLVLEPRSNISVSMLNDAANDVVSEDLELSVFDLVQSPCEFRDLNLIFQLAVLILTGPDLHFIVRWVFHACLHHNPMDVFPVHFRKLPQ